MPFYYDLARSVTTHSLTLTELTHFFGRTITNQQVAAICALFPAAQLATAGGGAARIKTNTGSIATGGGGQTPAPKNLLSRAADSVWNANSSSITPGSVLTLRMSVGFAQAGGPGGWIAYEPENRFQLQPGGTNPVDVEVTSVAVGTSVPLDLTVDLAEGL